MGYSGLMELVVHSNASGPVLTFQHLCYRQVYILGLLRQDLRCRMVECGI